ncbi:MAG: hypothetical protein ACOX6N_04185 [Patescibacteria group bacterium]
MLKFLRNLSSFGPKLITITLIFSLFTVSFFSLAPKKAYAWSAIETIEKFQNAINIGTNLEQWLFEAIVNNIMNLIAGIFGEIPSDAIQLIKDNNLGGLYDKTLHGQYPPSGVIGMTANYADSLTKPPVSGVQYIANIKDNFLGKTAYAQGVGFNKLAPIMPIWKTFRDVVYILSALIFIIIGAMIILRVKVGPQTVVTIQNAIPKLIITLILVTFSYAIAGLIIDLSQFIQSFTIALLYRAKGSINLSESLFAPYPIPIHTELNFQDLATANMNTVAQLTSRAIPWLAVLWWSLVVVILGGLFTIPAAGIGALAGLLIPLVIGIILLVWMFKFFFGALKAYVTIIFKIIIGPLEIALGAFPQSKIGFSSWIWSLIANIAIFPVTIIFLVIANLIIDATLKSSNDSIGLLWAPPIISGPSLQGFATSGALVGSNTLTVGIGIVTVLIVSQLPTLIPQAIFQIKPSPFGAAAEKNLSNLPLVAPVGKIVGGAAEKGAQNAILHQAGRVATRLGLTTVDNKEETGSGGTT